MGNTKTVGHLLIKIISKVPISNTRVSIIVSGFQVHSYINSMRKKKIKRTKEKKKAKKKKPWDQFEVLDETKNTMDRQSSTQGVASDSNRGLWIGSSKVANSSIDFVLRQISKCRKTLCGPGVL